MTVFAFDFPGKTFEENREILASTQRCPLGETCPKIIGFEELEVSPEIKLAMNWPQSRTEQPWNLSEPLEEHNIPWRPVRLFESTVSHEARHAWQERQLVLGELQVPVIEHETNGGGSVPSNNDDQDCLPEAAFLVPSKVRLSDLGGSAYDMADVAGRLVASGTGGPPLGTIKGDDPNSDPPGGDAPPDASWATCFAYGTEATQRDAVRFSRTIDCMRSGTCTP